MTELWTLWPEWLQLSGHQLIVVWSYFMKFQLCYMTSSCEMFFWPPVVRSYEKWFRPLTSCSCFRFTCEIWYIIEFQVDDTEKIDLEGNVALGKQGILGSLNDRWIILLKIKMIREVQYLFLKYWGNDGMLIHWWLWCKYASMNWVITGPGNGLSPAWCQAITCTTVKPLI